ncbi:tetratricopeptide repeat protein, partial [Candidatus Frankia alpina]|uniref:tetratricopeptide repeat protein n=1 Tax=Candidatus Frankia alpina TaxID=2699483 RepID=UPI0013D1E311
SASLYRRLADANPAAFLPNLATSLNTLASRLSDAGRRSEALHTAQESADLRRQLAEANPAAFLPDLAGSLNTLAAFLADAGQRPEALPGQREGHLPC